MTDNSKALQTWADPAMFTAEKIDTAKGPEVFLIDAPSDPLGLIAQAAKAYKGEFVESLAEITDEERRNYLVQIQKTILKMPLEAVHFSFRIKGVTRGFTHQLVRTRTAAYSQESTRFAVKDTVPVGLPPSLMGTTGEGEAIRKEMLTNSSMDEYLYRISRMSEAEKWRQRWDQTVALVEQNYNHLVEAGMPAEDARGLLPTNLLTQINVFIGMRSLMDTSGVRLCTQAQFEWRIVFAKIAQSIAEYGQDKTYRTNRPNGTTPFVNSSRWQFEAIANLFRPICYQTGKCQFGADFDRACSIRGRVDANASINRPSSQWGDDFPGNEVTDIGIPRIRTEEWMADPSAAR